MARVYIGPNGENIDQIQATRDVVVSHEVSDEVKDRIGAKLAECAGREQWSLGRMPAIRENLARNLRALHRTAFVSGARTAPPAIVASAGPSLDSFRSKADKTRFSAHLYVTNSATFTVDVADVVICVESFAVAMNQNAEADVTVIDAACHPVNWANAVGRRVHAFFRADAVYSGLAKRYGVEMLAYGSSVSTAAVALAARQGAPVIVLVGQDLCIHADGRYYPSAHPNGGMRAAFEKHGDQWVAIFRDQATGMERQPTPVWNDGTEEAPMWMTADFIEVREWLEEFARRHKHIRLINATSHGVNIAGWERMTLGDALVACDAASEPPKPERFPTLTGDLVSDVRLVRLWEAAVPECVLWQIEDRLNPPDVRGEGMLRWAIEIAQKSAKAMGLL